MMRLDRPLATLLAAVLVPGQYDIMVPRPLGGLQIEVVFLALLYPVE